ncbi:MAG: hypothetical protein AAF078_02565 [Planctomycetota bacterium]
MPVNFLPESYLQRRDLRQVKRKCVLLSLGGVLVVAAWGMVQFSATTRLGAKAEALAAEAQAAERMQLELTRLRDQHGSLLQQVEVGRELSMPLHQAEVIRLLSDVLPEEVVLSELNIQTVRPAPKPIQKADANPRRPARPQLRGAAPEPEVVEPDRLEISITGVASTDIVVAEAVNDLADHPLFADVTLHATRPVDRFGVPVRLFDVSLNTPLDRPIERVAAEGVMP